MRPSLIALALALFAATTLSAQSLQLGPTISVSKSAPVTLSLYYAGAAPGPASPYLDPSQWKAEWQLSAADDPTVVHVDSVQLFAESSTITLHLSGSLPAGANMRALTWTVALISDTVPFTTISSTPPPATTSTSCDDPSKTLRFLCPPTAVQPPDLTFSGNYLAGGGTSPIYSFELKGGIIFPQKLPFGFSPALNTQVEINQYVVPPVTRTRFDPDSITASFALTNFITFGQAGMLKGPLVGMRLQALLPEGEFNRSDPSSNVIAAGVATFDLRPWHSASHPSLYGTLYPFVGMEAGRNLNRPTLIDSVPVDLTRYKGIVRGYMGADATVAVAAPDRLSNVFAITGTYRVRLPAIDEPFVETLHQVTTVDLTTRARHWIEADANYTFPTWKYLSLNATYQYGDLPPLFPLVDHKFSLGFTFQAYQTTKPLGTRLVQ